jgi:hypothetical protein
MCYPRYIAPYFYNINYYVSFNKRISLNKILGQMTNRDLLKEAIADAKAVKETAIANAKAALEEAFTPHLKSMLAAKLEEMDKDEEVEEAMKSKEEDMMEDVEVNEEKNEIEEEFDLNEILAELEKEEMSEEVTEDEDEMEADKAEEESDEAETEEMEDEEIDLEDMTEADLKSFIEDVIADMVAAGELETGDEVEGDMDLDIEDDEAEMGELEEMDDVSWNEKNNPTRGETMKNLAPTKPGQTTSAYSINEKEFKQALDQISELKKELHEVNLLNAKLLYTNKIFNSKSLNESQKLRVLKAFDKASSVKEAKVIYETLNEGITSKTVKSSMANEIKSSASKSTGFIKENKQSIVEVDPMVARWQKLAGIK